MLARMSSRELSEWQAFYGLEPFGEERADLRAGIITATMANINRDPKKRRKPYSPQDFMPEFGAKRTETPLERGERLLGIAEMITAAFGGKDLRKDGNAV